RGGGAGRWKHGWPTCRGVSSAWRLASERIISAASCGRLGLKSVIKWKEYCRSGENFADIPYEPSKVYLHSGRSGYGDWLGTGAIATHERRWRTFKKARAFARSLKLKSA